MRYIGREEGKEGRGRPISAGISSRLFSPALRCWRFSNNLDMGWLCNITVVTVSMVTDSPEAPGETSDAIGLDVQFGELS